MNQHPTDIGALSLAEHSYFYVGSKYVEVDGRKHAEGGMYVEKFAPEEQSQSIPVVMIHGGGQTGTNFIGTPDGRRGWLHDFLRAGYPVYLVDQPERGRSGHSHRTVQGGHLIVDDVVRVEDYFSAPAKNELWPQARHHTQWPGTGEKGDPFFDQFFASQVDALWDRSDIERLNQPAMAELLDQIGPSILLTHSQSGPMGWLAADARPSEVKAILSVEPNGPPFFDVQFTGQEDWYTPLLEQNARPYGITRIPLSYEPPLTEGESLKFDQQAPEADEEFVTGYLQEEPARQLPNLQGIPIMILVGQASYHATYDHLTSAFLTQAGVNHDLVYLEQQGLKGNGHMIMLEENNHQVADLMITWLQTHCHSRGS